MTIKMSTTKMHATAREIALELIDNEGSDPTYLSIVESVDEFLTSYPDYEDINTESNEYEELQESIVLIVEKYISGAVITIAFPELNEEEV